MTLIYDNISHDPQEDLPEPEEKKELVKQQGLQELVDKILSLDIDTALADEAGLIAGRNNYVLSSFKNIIEAKAKRLEYPWQLFQWNDEWLIFML